MVSVKMVRAKRSNFELSVESNDGLPRFSFVLLQKTLVSLAAFKIQNLNPSQFAHSHFYSLKTVYMFSIFFHIQ